MLCRQKRPETLDFATANTNECVPALCPKSKNLIAQANQLRPVLFGVVPHGAEPQRGRNPASHGLVSVKRHAGRQQTRSGGGMRYQITQKCPESKALRYWSTAQIRIPATNLPKLQIDVVPPALRYRLISKFSRDPRRQWRKVCVAASSTLVTARLTCTVRPACGVARARLHHDYQQPALRRMNRNIRFRAPHRRAP